MSQFGELEIELFPALPDSPAGDLYPLEACFNHLGGEAEMRLAIHAGAGELHSLCWETLQDPEDGHDLGIDQNVLLSRYLSSPDWRPVQAVPRHALRAAAMAANPSDLACHGALIGNQPWL